MRLLARHHIVAPSLRVADAAAASVFGAARLRGPIARDVIAQVTGLSIATVNRQVTALLDAGVLRERADLAVSGAIGRPRVPVEVNHEPFLTLGIHIGARTTSIVATDLFGRTLDVVETPTPRGAQNAALASLAGSARRYLSRWHRRRPLWVGVAAGGVVDSTTGYLDHARLGWTDAPVGPVLAETLGLPVSVASHVDAMAGAELLLGVRRRRQSRRSSGTSLYVYARETVGYALSIGGRVHSPTSGPGTIAALPAQLRIAGRQRPAGVDGQRRGGADRGAQAQRIVPAEGPASTMPAVLRAARRATSRARALLAERAGCSARPWHCCATCSTPTTWWSAVRRSPSTPRAWSWSRPPSRQRSVLRAARYPADRVRQPRAGSRRGVVSLGGLYADPIAAMRRARSAAAKRPPDGASDRGVDMAVRVRHRCDGLWLPGALPCCRCTPRRWPSPVPAMPAA